MSILWTQKEAEKATGGKAVGEWRVTGVSINTRTIEVGDLFIALNGENGDGHKWVADALDKGAAAAVVASDQLPVISNQLVVDDTFKALRYLGQAARNRTKAKIIGVTGSVGKTTTKEMLACALAHCGRTHASAGGYNNHWGVPVSLARMPVDTAIGVFEMGMNHAGEIADLSAQVRPDVALITTIAAVHAEHFSEGEAGIAAAKAEIFDGMKPDGIAVLNRDNQWFEFLAEKAESCGLKVLSFGKHKAADVRLMEITELPSSNVDSSSPRRRGSIVPFSVKLEIDPPDKPEDDDDFRGGGLVEAIIDGTPFSFSLALSGQHMAMNAMGALAVVTALGGDVAQAARALGTMAALAGRGQRCVVNGVTILDESYNASPVAVHAGLKVLADTKAAGRKIVVLGDMYELGNEAVDIHKSLATDIENAGGDLVFTSGPLMEHLYKELPESLRGGHDNDSVSLAKIVATAVKSGDVVLVKGSRGGGEKPRMQAVVEALKERKNG